MTAESAVRQVRTDQFDRVVYSVAGSGDPLVLLHPVGLDQTWWAEHVEVFRRRHRVITVDLPGHGGSSPAVEGTRLPDLADAVLAVLDAESVASAHLLGVSMGGMVAQHCAIAAPARLAGLVLCSTAGTFPDSVRPDLRRRGEAAVEGGMAAVVAPTLERWFTPSSRDADLGRRCAATLLTMKPTSWAACWEAIAQHDALPALAGTPVPALVVTGSADVSTPPAAAETLAAALPGSRLRIVHGAAHLGVFDDSAPFTDAFTGFLDGVRSG